MSEERKKLRAGFRCLIVFAATLAIPILYLLLLGPTYCLLVHDKISDGTYRAVCYPLQLWGDKFGSTPAWFWQPYQRYMMWWYEFPGIDW